MLQTVNLSLQLVEKSEEAIYICKICHQVIGDRFQNVIRLLKWKLNLAYGKESQTSISTYDPLLYAVNLFITKIQSLALRKFIIDVNEKRVFYGF